MERGKTELKNLCDHLVGLLESRWAHPDFESAVKDFPEAKRGARVEGAGYTPWQLLEHLRIAQWDILEFSRNREHESPEWPEGYWPENESPPSGAAWEKSIRDFLADREAMKALVKAEDAELFEPIEWGDGQTLLREALLAADHNAYHLGQFILLRKQLGIWPAG